MNTVNEVEDLLARADRLQGGVTQMAFLQQATRLTDASNNIKMGFTARLRQAT